MKFKKAACIAVLCTAALLAPAAAYAEAPLAGYANESAGAVKLEKIGKYSSGNSNSDGGVAEIVSYDKAGNKAWVVNGATGMLDVLDMDKVTCGTSADFPADMPSVSIDVKALIETNCPGFSYGDMTSVSISPDGRTAAVALQEASYDKNGKIALINTEDYSFITALDAGVQPDMVTFTPDGTKVLSANEGEPRQGYVDGAVDPAGSITIVTIADTLTDSTSVTVGFDAFDAERDALASSGVLIKKNTAPSVDLEPEYIACDGSKAYVTLQEANAVAVLHIASASFSGVYSLGYKDLSLEKNAVDLLEDGTYSAAAYDAVAAYMPDGIACYTAGGQTYILTANEGDAREWGDYTDEDKATINGTAGGSAKKVRVLTTDDFDGAPEGRKVLFGGRSFSIYEVGENGLTQVYDSANEFEKKTAEYLPGSFNASNDDNDVDSRSRKKGTEPESVTIGTVGAKTYAFIGLERIGGVMMYDITDPANSTFVNYINTRDFSEDPADRTVGGTPLTSDIAPEGMCFISAEDSPSGTPVLLAAFEVSGTVAAYSVGDQPNGHIFGDYQSDGTGHWRVCEACGYTEETAAHTFGDWVHTGSHTHTCTVCGYSETEECEFGGWTITKAPTAAEKGEKVRTCAKCGFEEKAEIAATGTSNPTGETGSDGSNKPASGAAVNDSSKPATGDTSDIAMFICLLAAACVAVFSTMLLRKEAKK